MFLEIEGLTTNCADISPPGGQARATVLFLHGWAAPISLYGRVFERLLEKGYRVVAFDMPGVGGTAPPKAPLTVGDYVRFTLEVCRQMNVIECIIMCHSHGGRIALSMLTDESCPVKCKKAVLIDATGVVPPKAASKRLEARAIKLAKALGTHKLTAPVFGALYEKIRDARASDDYKAASPVMRQTMNNVLPADFQAAMPGIRADVLLVWGEHDTATPLAHGQIMERLIPKAGLAVIKNAGHFCFSDNWAQFSAVLDAFL